jgi:HSP20 family protein
MKTALRPARGLSRVLTDWLDSDSIFDRDLFDLRTSSLFARPGINIPSANVREDEKEYAIELAAPGLKRDDFTLEVDNGTLTVSAQKEEKSEERKKKDGYFRREYSYDSFSRSFVLPDNVREDEIKAQYNDGILTVSIPKVQGTPPKPSKKIAVS